LEIIQAIILGLVQGLTEFMPISSSAHLIIVPWLFGWQDFGIGFDVALHWGTLVAVLAYFWRDIIRYVRALFTGLPSFGPSASLGLTAGSSPATANPAQQAEQESDRRIAWLLLIATVPGAIAGLLLESKIDDSFHTPANLNAWGIYAIAGAMIVMGLVLLLAERLYSGKGKPLTGITLVDAVIIGLAQAVAVLPGVSRSGATITAGLFRKINRADAARFSFLLSSPIIVAAGLKKLYDLIKDPAHANPANIPTLAFILGFLAAAIGGYLTIRFLIGYLQRRSTAVFVVYRLVLGVALIILAMLNFRR